MGIDLCSFFSILRNVSFLLRFSWKYVTLRLLPCDDCIVIMFLLQFVITSNSARNVCIFSCRFFLSFCNRLHFFHPNFVTSMHGVCNWTRGDFSWRKMSRYCETKLLILKICWIDTFQLNFYYFCILYLYYTNIVNDIVILSIITTVISSVNLCHLFLPFYLSEVILSEFRLTLTPLWISIYQSILLLQLNLHDPCTVLFVSLTCWKQR